MGIHTHARYTDAEALAAAIAGGLSEVIWKDASERALIDLNRTTTLDWTDLDLTASTSANAKFAVLKCLIHIDSITAGSANYAWLELRKNGTTPTYRAGITVDGGWIIAGSYFVSEVIVGLDAGQIVEYKLTAAGTVQFDSYIDVLGYIE